MTETTISKEIREKLREPFPDEAVKQHPTKTFLSTIKAIYIVERLNNVFGIGGWGFDHEIVSDEPDYVVVCGAISIIDSETQKVKMQTLFQYGGHKKKDVNTEPADGYKSAVTDCLSKCASYLEIGIDVFKGKHTAGSKAPKTAKKETSEKDNELSSSQWKFLKSLGVNINMTEEELIIFVKWVAEENKIEPRSYKIAKLLLPQENFDSQLAKFSQANIKVVMEDDMNNIPF